MKLCNNMKFVLCLFFWGALNTFLNSIHDDRYLTDITNQILLPLKNTNKATEKYSVQVETTIIL